MFSAQTKQQNLQEKSLAVQFVEQELDINEFLSEFIDASIKKIENNLERDSQEITIEQVKEIVILKMSEILKKQLIKESIENFTEKEIAYLNDKFAQFQLKFFREVDHNTTRFAQLFNKINTLDIQLEKFARKTDSFNLRLDQFENQVSLIEKNIGSFATKNYIDETFNREINEQTNLLNQQIISQDFWETLSQKNQQVQSYLETKIDQIRDEIRQDNRLVNQVNELKTELATKPTTKEFIIGIGIAIGLTIVGVLASTSWMIEQKIKAVESQFPTKVGHLENKIDNSH